MSDDFEVYKPESVNLGEIADLGGFNAVGEYTGRLNRLDPTTSSKGDPMLVAYFEVLEGPHAGEEIRFNYWLGARKNKKTSRIFAPGVSEIKQACAMIGSKLNENMDFRLDANFAGQLFNKVFGGKRVRIKVLPDPERKDRDGNKVEGKWSPTGQWEGPTRPKILGLATSGVAANTPVNTPVNQPAAQEGEPVSPLRGIV